VSEKGKPYDEYWEELHDYYENYCEKCCEGCPPDEMCPGCDCGAYCEEWGEDEWEEWGDPEVEEDEEDC
jgi:hypothetical protein